MFVQSLDRIDFTFPRSRMIQGDNFNPLDLLGSPVNLSFIALDDGSFVGLDETTLQRLTSLSKRRCNEQTKVNWKKEGF